MLKINIFAEKVLQLASLMKQPCTKSFWQFLNSVLVFSQYATDTKTSIQP